MAKRKDETFLVFNFDTLWNGYSDTEDTILCLSERHIAMLLHCLRPASWPSRWIGDSTGNGRDTYEQTLLRENGRYQDLETALSFVERLEHILMTSCAEALLQGLQAVAAALGNINIVQNCGSGTCGTGPVSGYIQGTASDGGPMYGSQEGLSGNEETGIPDDWTGTAEEWFERKCRIANHLFDGIMSSLRNLAGISIVNLVGGGIAIGYVASLIGAGVVFPPALLPLLIAAVIAVGAALALLDQLADYMESHRDELVCAFYNAKNVSEAYDAFGDYIDEALAALAIPSAVSPHIRTIALLLASTDTLNTLFDIYIDVAYAGADCSNCNDEGVPFEFGADGVNVELLDGEMIAPHSGFTEITVYGERDANNIALSLHSSDYVYPDGTCLRYYVVSCEGASADLCDGRICDASYVNGINPFGNHEWITWNLRLTAGLGNTATVVIRVTADLNLDLTP